MMWALEKRKHSKEHKTAEVVWKEVSDKVTFELRLAQVEGSEPRNYLYPQAKGVTSAKGLRQKSAWLSPRSGKGK